LSTDKASSEDVGGEEQRVARLQRDLIVGSALQMLDEVGLDGLSTRTLATRLGVQSPALYWHFGSKRDLLDAMADTMLVEAGQPAPPRPGDEVVPWLTERGCAFRRALLSHRDGARVHAGSRPQTGQLPSLEAQAVALTAAGLSAEDALRALLAISRYTIGWVLEEQADAARAAEVPATDRPAFEDHATLRSARAIFEQRDPDSDFEFGLTALVAGLTDRTRTGAPHEGGAPGIR